VSACPECGAAVDPELMADHLMRHGILPEERPGVGPKSPGAVSGETPPADSAAVGARLHVARSCLDAVDRELAKVAVEDGFRPLLAATRAQTKIQAAADLIDGARVDLGGEISDAEEAPANGGTEGEARTYRLGPGAGSAGGAAGVEIGFAPRGVLDVTRWPSSTREHLIGRLTAAIVGYRAGAGAYPAGLRMRSGQADELGDPLGNEPLQFTGIPIEVLGEDAGDA
jgi:hypothetical protein